jgi:predicted SAM-dependent methyltransferase
MIQTDSADAVAAIHVLEHFYEWEAFDVLTEWKRILKPGGKMILELPCMDKVFGYVVQCIQKNEAMQPFMTTLAMYGDPKHKSVEMTHKWGWFANSLKALLADVGMREIRIMEPSYHFKMRDIRFECVK